MVQAPITRYTDQIMSALAPCFTHFSQSTDGIALPERFTFPFYYDPHPLSVLAANELQQHLTSQTKWQHNFGLTGELTGAIGKMFGVLVVQTAQGEIGYLSAFSGKLADSNHIDGFVPPVFDMLTQDGFFGVANQHINSLNHAIDTLEADPRLSEFNQMLADETQQAEQQIAAHRQAMIESRKHRKAQRQILTDVSQLAQLAQASIFDKNQLRDLKRYWDERIDSASAALSQITDKLTQLRLQRKTQSADLQQKLFEQYRFLNIEGQEKSLYQIFNETVEPVPPAGSGECAAPKLLHYAFKWHLTPLALAEFWWGAAPKSEVRQHKMFYPACKRKCQPILSHMLSGLSIDDNPLLINPGEGQSVDILYQDEVMAVINKPAEFLSVPGKDISDSVYSRMQQQFPHATGPLIVHRLDMSTSGLMVIALTKDAHKHLQKQFIRRSAQKRYVALIEGVLAQDSGTITLPLRGDLDDRPKQLVCFEHGKYAETHWQVISRTATHTKINLYPKTGRTHQLRVHCAHAQGLNMPIVGDDLYGTRAHRLHLHAQQLTLIHPQSQQPICFECEADF